IAEVVDCTIGMNQPIGDDAAIVFAASFYRALGFGRSVQEAFELGKVALLLEGLPEDKAPELLARSGIDASKVVLVRPPRPAMPSAGEPGVKLPVKQMGDLKRLTLVKDMSGLDPADWATFVTVIPGATSHISRQGTVAEQVADLVRWAESTTGPGLAAI